MSTHEEVDRRSLRLAQAVARKVDASPELLEKVRAWAGDHPSPALDEWRRILTQDWSAIRAQLLRPDSVGQNLRQNSPFVGILSPKERWAFYD